MTPTNDLKELAKQAIDEGEYQALDFLIAKLKQLQTVPAIVEPKTATVQPVLIAETAFPGLDQSRFLDHQGTVLAVTKYLHQLNQNPFRFVDVANYIESNYSNALNLVYKPGDQTPIWRRQISDTLAAFCINGWLKKEKKPKTHYSVTSLFFELNP